MPAHRHAAITVCSHVRGHSLEAKLPACSLVHRPVETLRLTANDEYPQARACPRETTPNCFRKTYATARSASTPAVIAAMTKVEQMGVTCSVCGEKRPPLSG